MQEPWYFVYPGECLQSGSLRPGERLEKAFSTQEKKLMVFMRPYLKSIRGLVFWTNKDSSLQVLWSFYCLMKDFHTK